MRPRKVGGIVSWCLIRLSPGRTLQIRLSRKSGGSLQGCRTCRLPGKGVLSCRRCEAARPDRFHQRPSYFLPCPSSQIRGSRSRVFLVRNTEARLLGSRMWAQAQRHEPSKTLQRTRSAPWMHRRLSGQLPRGERDCLLSAHTKFLFSVERDRGLNYAECAAEAVPYWKGPISRRWNPRSCLSLSD